MLLIIFNLLFNGLLFIRQINRQNHIKNDKELLGDYDGAVAGNVDNTKKWMEEVKANGSIPHLALEANNGLDVVKEDDYLIDLAKMFGELDIPIYLRFASLYGILNVSVSSPLISPVTIMS